MLAALAVAAAGAAGSTRAPTTVRDQSGAAVGSIIKSATGWTYGPAADCWVQQSDATTIVAGRHRDVFGRAARVSRSTWRVWNGAQLLGSVVNRSAGRWEIRVRGAVRGSTQGPDGPAAAAAWLLLGRCD